MKSVSSFFPLIVITFLTGAIPAALAQEHQIKFSPATENLIIGDWQGQSGTVAQVFLSDGRFQANLLRQFDQPDDKPLAVLQGNSKGDEFTFNGGDWHAQIAKDHLTGGSAKQNIDLQRVTRKPPSLGATPPKGAVVLFNGRNLDRWAKKKGKDWLAEDGPAQWKILPDGVLEVVPNSDCIITHQKFGDCKVHVEFRTLGTPSNSGVFLQTRYEVNINETYGKFDGTPNGGLDNCTPANARPQIRATRPPLEWQTFDIDFRAPRFDADGNKTENARATVVLNGVTIYEKRELERPRGAASRLGEAPTGPLMLQEHGMPVQFRNIWLLPAGGDSAKPLGSAQ
jgi:Domain of Unknown Function (DUF1080)